MFFIIFFIFFLKINFAFKKKNYFSQNLGDALICLFVHKEREEKKEGETRKLTFTSNKIFSEINIMNLRKSVMEKKISFDQDIMDRASENPINRLESSSEDLISEKEYFNEDFLPDVTLRAVQCALEIQQKYPEYDSNEGFKLSLHIGIGCGTLNAM
jgi:hypothetical protein